VYPNPAMDQVLIRNNTGDTWHGRLLDLNGATVQTIEVSDKQQQLDISRLAQGIYFLQLGSRQHVVTKKLIKLK